MKDISKTIEIKCDCSETVDFHELKDFQGGLKTRDKSDYEKMKTSILKYGWSFCLYYWNDGKDKYIIDGRNRRFVLGQLEKEGYFIPPIPAIEVFATDRAEAKQKLLRLNSTYGTLTADSVIEFVGNDFELNTEEIALPSGVLSFNSDEEDNTYTKKVEAPIYEPKENTPPQLEELYDTDKYEKLKEQIESAALPENVKEFLRLASYRFIRFDFTKIAEYYAHCEDSELKELFELLALVIIDYDKAIENGFVELEDELSRMFNNEVGEENDE